MQLEQTDLTASCLGSQEVLVLPNAQFKVIQRLVTPAEKEEALDDLSAYDMADLNVYVLEQL